MRGIRILAAACLAAAVAAAAGAQDIVIIGEVHDNPAHHATQARIVEETAPAALVFEMLTPAQARRVTPALRGDAEALGAALGWEAAGWPDFDLYFPIFAAAPGASIHGAGVPREAARRAMKAGLAAAFDGDPARYGLDRPLPGAEQAAREAAQARAHCDALPGDMLPGMVAVQRLRDATLARAAVRAHARTGGPVVVITGNGHARPDRGVPVYLARAAPGLEVRSIGQTEDGAPLPGGFDTVISAPAPERDDPCAALR